MISLRIKLGENLKQLTFITYVLIGVLICANVKAQPPDDQTTNVGDLSLRWKRQYYDENYYSNYYGWQVGRLIGWALGFFVLLLIVCVPCICCIGIWFVGWFGIRRAIATRRSNSRGTTYPPPTAQHQVTRIVSEPHPSSARDYDNNTRIVAIEERQRVTQFEEPLDERLPRYAPMPRAPNVVGR